MIGDPSIVLLLSAQMILSIPRHCCSEIYMGDPLVHPKKTTKKEKEETSINGGLS
jgi:hypothetical protein